MITRIQQLKDHYGLSTRALALKCGLNQPTLDRMLKGINALNLNCITSILQSFPEVSSEWLLRGEGEMFRVATSDPNMERVSKLIDTITTLQETINSQRDTISSLRDQISKLENQLNSK